LAASAVAVVVRDVGSSAHPLTVDLHASFAAVTVPGAAMVREAVRGLEGVLGKTPNLRTELRIVPHRPTVMQVGSD
jgi:hypothetical protein